jgi:hypothetical protein
LIVINFFVSSLSNFINSVVTFSARSKLNALHRLQRKRQKIALASLAMFVFNLVLGSLLFGFVFNEKEMSFVEAVFATVVTLSTVGYGDYTLGNGHNGLHVLGGVYILFATATTAWCVSAMVAVVSSATQRRLIEARLDEREVAEADVDGDQILSKSEYVLYKLKKIGRIDSDIIASLEQQFVNDHGNDTPNLQLQSNDDEDDDDAGDDSERIPLIEKAMPLKSQSAARRLRARAFSLLFGNDVVAERVDFAIRCVIIIAVGGFVFNTVPGWYDEAKQLFDAIEWVVSLLFTIEYIVRVYCCIDDPKYHQYGNVLGRLRYMISFTAVGKDCDCYCFFSFFFANSHFHLVDILSIIPFYTSLFLSIGGHSDIKFSGAVRVLRLARVLRIDSHNR